MKKLRTTRDITTDECPWLHEDIPAGATLTCFARPTYGCIGWDGIAVTLKEDGDYPFFEVPADAVVRRRA